MADWGKKIPGGYFDEVKHVYRDDEGAILPSVTQIFEMLHFTDFSGINEDVLEWKRQFGTSVHSAVEYLVQNDLDWDSMDLAIVPAVTGIEQRLKEIQYKSIAVEEGKIMNLFGMKYGGTLDHRGTCVYQGQVRDCIIDLKTASKEEKYWKWQVASYTVGVPKTKLPIIGIVLKVDKDGKVVPYFYDVRSSLREFQVLLAACILGINNGIYQLRK